MKHLKVARVTMEDNVVLTKSLMLNGRRKHTYTGWLEQASMFYGNGLDSPEALTALLEYNITKNKMKAGQALVKQTAAALKTQLKELGEAQRATEQRDKAFDLMEEDGNIYRHRVYRPGGRSATARNHGHCGAFVRDNSPTGASVVITRLVY